MIRRHPLLERLALADGEAERAALLVDLAAVSVQPDRSDDAVARLREAAELYVGLEKGAPGRFEEQLASVHLQLGQLLAKGDHLVDADASLRLAAALFEKLSTQDEADRARLSGQLLSALSALGRLLLQAAPDEAVCVLERALSLYDQEADRGRTTYALQAALDQSALGTALALLERNEESARVLSLASTRFDGLAHAGADVAYALARNLSSLAGVWRALSRWEDAIAVSNRAIGIYARLDAAGAGPIVRQRLRSEIEFRESARVISGEQRTPGGEAAAGWKTTRWIIGKIGSGAEQRTTQETTESAAREEDQSRAPQVVSAQDRRFWCTTFRNVSSIFEALIGSGLPFTNAHALAAGLRERSLYPVRDLEQHFSRQRASVFVSHDWSDGLANLQSTLNSAMQLVASIVCRHRPDLGKSEVEELCWDRIGIWVDFLFIDQNARNVLDEVNFVVPAVIDAADLHFMLSPTAISRAWCCYELAMFNRRPTREGGEGLLRSIIAPAPSTQYPLWRAAKTTVPEDKPVLESWLRRNYPGGLDGMDALLVIANMQSDSFVSGPWSLTGGAEELVVAALEKWSAR